jgi:hypothetical protein
MGVARRVILFRPARLVAMLTTTCVSGSIGLSAFGERPVCHSLAEVARLRSYLSGCGLLCVKMRGNDDRYRVRHD